jgi:acyl carrier protein
MNEIKDKLRRIIVQALRLNREPESIPDNDLTSELGLDSINSLEVLIWVENEFGIQIDDEDLSVALINSLDVLAAYVEKKLHAKEPSPAAEGEAVATTQLVG